MSPRKQVSKAQAARSEKIIQYSALAVILAVGGVFVWNLVLKNQMPQNSACYLFDSIPAADQYELAPPLLIDPNGNYLATIALQKGGEIQIELYPDKAPNTVNSFMFLACKGFYDGVTFHRALEGFMAQTGDPSGTGMGGAGYRFDDEINNLTFDREGVLAMANSGPHTNGSQFFITLDAAEHLNGIHTIFGQVTSGMDAVKTITLRDPDQNPPYDGDVIDTITITEE